MDGKVSIEDENFVLRTGGPATSLADHIFIPPFAEVSSDVSAEIRIAARYLWTHFWSQIVKAAKLMLEVEKRIFVEAAKVHNTRHICENTQFQKKQAQEINIKYLFVLSIPTHPSRDDSQKKNNSFDFVFVSFLEIWSLEICIHLVRGVWKAKQKTKRYVKKISRCAFWVPTRFDLPEYYAETTNCVLVFIK